MFFAKFKECRYVMMKLSSSEGRMKLETQSFNVIEMEPEMTPLDGLQYRLSRGVTYRFVKDEDGHSILKDFDIPFDKDIFDSLVVFLKTSSHHIDYHEHRSFITSERSELFEFLDDISDYNIPSLSRIARLRAIGRDDPNTLSKILNNLLLDTSHKDTWDLDALRRYAKAEIRDGKPISRLLESVVPSFSIKELAKSDSAYQLIESYNDISVGEYQQHVVAIYEVDQHGRLLGSNKRLLWHGTPSYNVPAILQNGFERSNNEMTGEGIYFTDTSMTASLYANNPDSERRRVNPFSQHSKMIISTMLLCEVALGKVLDFTHGWLGGSAEEEEYALKEMNETDSDSVYIQGSYVISKSAVLNGVPIATEMVRNDNPEAPRHSEYFIFNSEQVIVKYLVICAVPDLSS